MGSDVPRRDLLKLLGLGGVVFASGLGLTKCLKSGAPWARRASGAALVQPPGLEDFFFLQLSDTHWGFQGPANPEAELTLRETVSRINAVETQPDLIVFTGDLTHTTDDPKERRARLAQFKEIVSELKVRSLRFLPGEHDAASDRGEAFVEALGPTHYSFDHKGVHFVALDNASDPAGLVGDAQLEWLDRDLSRLPRETPIVVLAHRPLFDLYPAWDWATTDGARVLGVLEERPNVTVFYGHIHQEHHHVTGTIAHHSARSLVFPLPAPGSAPKRAPLPWDPGSADHGLGHTEVRLAAGRPRPTGVPFRRGSP